MPAPVVAAALPAAIGAGAGLLGNRQSDTDRSLQRGQLNALTSQSALASQLGSLAKRQYELSAPAYQKALSYYNSLLGGNAAARQQALAPDIRRVNETYRGAETSTMNRSTGAARDRDLADLKRQQVAQLAELGGAPRAGAAATLLSAGQQGYGDLIQALLGQSGVNSSVLSGTALAQQTERDRRRGQADTAQDWMKAFLPQLIAAFAQGGGGGRAPRLNTSLLPGGGGFGIG